jgi:hypothetical protein
MRGIFFDLTGAAVVSAATAPCDEYEFSALGQFEKESP